MAKTNRVNVVDESGIIQSIPAEQLADAQKQGYRLASQQEVKEHFAQEKFGTGVVNPLAAAAAGAARGLSFGLSDIALTKSGLVEPETLKGLEKYQPAASLAGEVGGVAGSLLVPVGPAVGAVGKAAQVATAPVRGVSKAAQAAGKAAVEVLPEATTAMGRIARGGAEMAIGGAAEGALYGAGRALTEHAFGDPADLGEAVLAHAGITALLGGTLGGALGITGAAGAESLAAWRKMFPQKQPLPPEAGKMAVNRTPEGKPEVIVTAPEGTLARQLQEDGVKTSEIDKLYKTGKLKPHDADIVKSGQELGVPVFEMQRSADDAVQTMQEVLSHRPTKAGLQLRAELDDAFGKVERETLSVLDSGGERLTVEQAGKRSADAIRAKVDDLYANVRKVYDAQAPTTGIAITDKQHLKFFDKLQVLAQDMGDIQSVRRQKVENYADRIMGSPTIGDLDKIVTEINEEIRMSRRSDAYEMAHALGQLKNEIGEFQDKIVGKALGKEALAVRKEARKTYKEFIETVGDLAGGGRMGKIRTYSELMEKLDDVSFTKLAESLFDKKNVKALKFLQEKFPDVLDSLVKMKKTEIIEKATKDNALSTRKVLSELKSNKLSPEVQAIMFTPEELQKLKAVKTWVEAMPDRVNPSGTSKALDYFNLTDGNPLNLAAGKIKDAISDFITTQRIQASVDNLHYLNRVAESATRVMKKIELKAKEVFKDSGRVRSLAVQKAAEQFTHKEQEKLISQVHELNNNPELFLEKLEKETESINQSVPETTQFMNASAVRAVQYLSAAAPMTKNDYVLGQDFKPSKYELAIFGQRAKILNNPTDVLTHLKNGTLVPAHIEAVATVYPKLFQAMQREILTQMADAQAKKKMITQDKKNMLSMFLNYDLVQSITSQGIMQNQAALNASGQPTNQADANMMSQPKPTAKGLGNLNQSANTMTYMAKSAQRMDRAQLLPP